MALKFQNEYKTIKGPDLSGFTSAIEDNPNAAKNLGKGLLAPFGLIGGGIKALGGAYDWTRRQIEGGLDSTTEVTDEIIPEEEEDVNFIQAAWNKLKGDPKVTTEDLVEGFERPEVKRHANKYWGETDKDISPFIANPDPEPSFLEQDNRTWLQRAWMNSRFGGGPGHFFPNSNQGDI